MPDRDRVVSVNRAPVLTLWTAVISKRLGLDEDEALTVGRALSGLTAHAKGVRLGIFEPSQDRIQEHRKSLEPGEVTGIRLMGRDIPLVHTPQGLRAVSRGKPIKAEAVRKYLAGKFGTDLDPVTKAMEALAASMPEKDLASRAFNLYEQFRPAVKSGAAGWGQEGSLSIAQIQQLADR
jgi:hypothetical protein